MRWQQKLLLVASGALCGAGYFFYFLGATSSSGVPVSVSFAVANTFPLVTLLLAALTGQFQGAGVQTRSLMVASVALYITAIALLAMSRE